MIRTVVLDRLLTAQRRMSTLLAAEPDVEVVHAGASNAEPVAMLATLQPALMFLDSDLCDAPLLGAVAAMETAIRPQIVIVTAYEHCAVEAFSAGAADYLLKPVSAERMKTCLVRVRRGRVGSPVIALTDARSARPPAHEIANTSTNPLHGDRIALRVGRKRLLLPRDSIDRCEAAGNYVIFHAGETRHVVRGAIGEVPQLLGLSQFVRISKSTVVNTARIVSLEAIGEGDLELTLSAGGTHTVSRVYRKDLEANLARIPGLA